jgi:cation diffusion facilitator family transporter
MTALSHGLAADETAALTRRVTLLSVATAAVLVVAKAAVWLASDSVALLASAADSALDLLASLVTFFAVRYAAAPPDAEHRYGHGKAEAFASLVQAGLVFASAALIGQEAIRHLTHPTAVGNTGWALAVMGLSILLTGLLVMAQSRMLSQASSVAVAGDRAHYLSDFAGNLAALAGIAGVALTGSAVWDAIAGLAVAAVLLWAAVQVFRDASGQLMDHELPQDERLKILELAKDDPRVLGVHQLRTRASGPYVHIQMHMDVDPDLSLMAAHELVVAAEGRVLQAFPAADIIIHPDPRGRAEPHGGAFAERHEETEPATTSPMH